MSRQDPDGDIEGRLHPRHSADLVGHGAAETALLDAFRSGRMPHAWLLGGPAGIGKATLAYRLARFVLAHPDPATPAVQGARSLALAPEHPAFRRVAAQGHPDLLALYRTEGDTGRLRTVISVEQVRRTVGFFGSTAGEGGWRVCIVDTADDLHVSAFNALLKILEEPPPRSLLLLLTAAPGRLAPTIRSRCRRLALRPLPDDQVAALVAGMTERSADDAEVAAATAAAPGSPGQALALLEGGLMPLRERVAALLGQLPRPDPVALHALGDAIAGADPEPLAVVVSAVRDWLSARLGDGAAGAHRLARVAEVWDKVGEASRQVEAYNLDRKPFVFNVFGMLAEAAP